MPSRPERPQITLLEKLKLFLTVFAVVGKLVTVPITGLLVDKKHRPASYFKYVAYSVMRTAFAGLSSRQEQWAFPGTDEAYAQYCTSRKITPVSETLSDGTKAHWIGSKGTQNVLLYFHGGGYNVSANPEHFEFLSDILSYVNGDTPSKLSILVLSYTVAPYATYPRQLEQGVALLKHTLQELNYAPENILMGGDSAGGNLTLGVLSHLLHPHSNSLIPKIELQGRLKGAYLISPWVEFDTSANSYSRNAWKDAIPTTALHRWSSNFMGSAARDPYNSPLSAPSGWWKGLNNVVENVYICGGSDEILIDDILKLQEKLKAEWEGNGKMEFELVEGEAHDSILCDRLIGYKSPPPKMDGVVRRWLCESI